MFKVLLSTTILLFALTAVKAQESTVIKKGAKLKLISDKFKFTEGPASDKKGNVYFTDQPNNRILKWNAKTDSITTFMNNAGRANGLYIDKNQNLYACADLKFELWKIDQQKKVTVLLDSYNNKKLNGPNDLWVDDKGGIYFTDPYYQRDYWSRQHPEMKDQKVYYLSPDGKNLSIAAENFIKPNGIIGSSKKGILYIADIGANKTYAYTIAPDGKLIDKRLFVSQGSDGMTMDHKGNIYLTGKGVTIYNKNGEKIEHIEVNKDWTANVTFGGTHHHILFITASNSVYTIEMKTKSNQW
ncbi:SMP-30/gluconolactonase/LRE family protein [Zhouia sp. PK063]|uniref:SMP-30/gluconolactonase/LRE family protein n=1 Tax=Zhouia sp. PK063 TaxID=3373602 RepID=UPI00378B727A